MNTLVHEKSLRNDGHNMVRPNTSRTRRTMRLHIVCPRLSELDRDRSISPIVGTEFCKYALSGGGIDAEVVHVGVVGGERDCIFDGLPNFSCFGSTQDHEVGLVDIAEVGKEEMLLVWEGLEAEGFKL